MSWDVEVGTIPDYGYGFVNMSGLEEDVVGPQLRQVAAQLNEWVSSGHSNYRSRRAMWDRNAYIVSDNPLHQMEMARQAVRDDYIVSGAADVIEGMTFQQLKWECDSADDADVFNQINTDINLDAFVRAANRELFTVSQVCVASWWQRKTYKVRGRSTPKERPKPPIPDALTGVTPPPDMPKRGPKRKKEYDLYVPTQLTVLDSRCVVPVGNRLWGGDRLAWHGTPEEIEIWDSGIDQPSTADPSMQQLILGKYIPSLDESAYLSSLGIMPDRLLELNPARVWRHRLSAPSYQRWPDIRLKGVFRLLDLKTQLMEADRVTLIGAANYILLIKKGAKDEPAHQSELQNLRDNFEVLAKLPVIISDHRLDIEIITPKVDVTIHREKYDVLDQRILSHVLGALTLSGQGQRNESSLTVGRMVARLLESRRHMLRRAIEQNIAKAIMDANPGAFEDEPNLAFIPRRLELDNDDQITQVVLAARQSKELSRESFLEYIGYDEEVEANRRVYEATSGLDDIFQTAVPFNSPANTGNTGGLPPGALGATGGRPTGGGQPNKNPAASGGTSNTGKASGGGKAKS